MERRDFLRIAVGLAAGAAVLAGSAQAAPLALAPLSPITAPLANGDAHPAVTSSEEASRLTPEEVRWGHHWHHRWHRHWGWHRRHWGRHRHHWHRHWRRW